MPLLDAKGNPITAAKPKRRQPMALGWGGSKIIAGIPTDEYNAELRGRKAAQVYEKMRRTSGQVRSILTLIGLPLRSTAWFIEEPDGAGSSEKEAAEALRENLFGGMETSFDELIRMGVMSAYFGYGVPEIVWGERDGYNRVEAVEDRNRDLIERWLPDERGRIVGYVYAGNRPTGKGLNDLAGGTTTYERRAIPLPEHTLHFCYEGDYGNPEGLGLGRTMYPYWHFSQAMMKIIGIGVERNLLSIPVGKMENEVAGQKDDEDSFYEGLTRLRAGEEAAFLLKPGQSLDWLEGKSTVMDAMPFLHYQDSQMAKVALAGFMNLGTQDVGTQALGETQAKVFMEAEEGLASWIEETANAQLLKTWCRYNYGEGLKCPTLRHRKIQARSLEAIAQALSQLTGCGALTMTDDDEEYFRDLAEFPAIPREQLTTLREEAKKERREERQARSRDGAARTKGGNE